MQRKQKHADMSRLQAGQDVPFQFDPRLLHFIR